MDKGRRIRGFYVIFIFLLSTTLLTGCFLTEKKAQDKGEVIIVKPEENKEETDGTQQNKGDKDIISENENSGVFPGDYAYDFTLLDREGNEIKLSDLKGKVVVVSFWTTWSNYSIYEMPYIQEVYNLYDHKDVVILAVDVLAAEKKDQGEINQFVDENGYTFPVLYDVDGSVSVQYKVSTFPTTYIIDKEGKISDAMSVVVDKDVMIEKIESARNQ